MTSTPDPLPMVIEQVTDLGKEALIKPFSYNGFMGISILNKFFAKKRMKHYFIWASQHFKEFQILLMDDPDKYNFMVFKDMSATTALEKARVISDEIKVSYQRELEKLNITNIKIIQFRDFIGNESYQKILSATLDCLQVNSAFKEDLYSLIEVSIGGKIIEYAEKKHLDNNNIATVKKNLSQYIIEEFAALIYFTEKGFPIELDPTKEFSTKRLLYEGLFKNCDLFYNVSRRGHIYLHPEGITKASY